MCNLVNLNRLLCNMLRKYPKEFISQDQVASKTSKLPFTLIFMSTDVLDTLNIVISIKIIKSQIYTYLPQQTIFHIGFQSRFSTWYQFLVCWFIISMMKSKFTHKAYRFQCSRKKVSSLSEIHTCWMSWIDFNNNLLSKLYSFL